MISLKTTGKFIKTAKYLYDISGADLIMKERAAARKYASDIVTRLSSATPVDTGKTAASWSYDIKQEGTNVRLNFYNSNISDGCCVAVLLQYGHATPSGVYVQGIDYINPACKPYFDKIEEVVWKEVAKS